MALRDNPYLPLYVQDFLTDEKLIECSASTTGVYIRLMCIMHKSEEYGKICYNKRDVASDNPVLDFAKKLSKQMPYPEREIYDGLCELIDLKIIGISSEKNGKKLIQKRMVRDADLSEKRAKSGKKGMEKRYKSTDIDNGFSYNKTPNKSTTNSITNTENEIDIENEDENVIEIEKGGTGGKTVFEQTFESFRKSYPGTKRGFDIEFKTLRKHIDWKNVVLKLLPALEQQQKWRTQAAHHGVFVPGWPMLQTWLNQRRWEEELNFDFSTAINGRNNQTAGNGGNVSDDYKRRVLEEMGISPGNGNPE